jgi:hypothetical protein
MVFQKYIITLLTIQYIIQNDYHSIKKVNGNYNYILYYIYINYILVNNPQAVMY